MDKIISVIVSSVFTSLASIYMWSKLYNEKIDFKNIKNYVVFVALILFTSLNYMFVNNFIKVFTIILIMGISNNFLFRKKYNETILSTVVSQFMYFIAELIVTLIAFCILKIDASVAVEQYFGTFQINLIIAIECCLIINFKIINKLYSWLINITDKISNFALLLILSVVVIIANFFMATQYYDVDSKYIVIINSSLIIIYSFFVFKMLEQKNRYIKINNKYNMTNTTLKELEQNVTRLKITNHENKNQLLTIRNMIKKGEDSKKLIKHIEKIVDKKVKDDEQLMFQTSTITNSMISSIIYSKMLTMKENNINASLLVDRDIKDLYLSDMSEDLSVEVCKVIGVFLDNAIEEVMTLEERIINIEFYVEGKMLCISISNNYKGEIEIDKLDNPGYTTKENGHGYGLSLVSEIVNDNEKLSMDREIDDNIFKQILKIKM